MDEHPVEPNERGGDAACWAHLFDDEDTDEREVDRGEPEPAARTGPDGS